MAPFPSRFKSGVGEHALMRAKFGPLVNTFNRSTLITLGTRPRRWNADTKHNNIYSGKNKKATAPNRDRGNMYKPSPTRPFNCPDIHLRSGTQ